MLEELERQQDDRRVCRMVGPSEMAAFARQKGLDDREISEVLRLTGQPGSNELLDGPFTRKTEIFPPHGFPSGRFSDGSWPVFNSAASRTTAEMEAAYHRVKALAAKTSSGVVYCVMLECDFNGTVIDLRSEATRWPEIISDATINSTCQQLGREGHEEVDAFLAPSVRDKGGTTVPVFRRASLSNGATNGRTKITYVHDTGTVLIEGA